MMKNPRKLVVVGQGAAGLAATLSAAEQTRSRNLSVDITVLEKVSEAESRGQYPLESLIPKMVSVDRRWGNYPDGVSSFTDKVGTKWSQLPTDKKIRKVYTGRGANPLRKAENEKRQPIAPRGMFFSSCRAVLQQLSSVAQSYP
jgi:hypothetical protein